MGAFPETKADVLEVYLGFIQDIAEREVPH